MSLLTLENVPNSEISGLLDNESQWVTHDFEGRFLNELSDGFLGLFWTEENEDNSNDILEELNDRKLHYSEVDTKADGSETFQKLQVTKDYRKT